MGTPVLAWDGWPAVRYEEQTEVVVEDEAAFEDRTQAVMENPSELVPAVRELIARHGR